MKQPVEYDVHGLVGVRVEGATAGDLVAIDRRLGALRAPLGRPPDISIRFVDGLVGGSLRRVGDDGLDTAAGFLLLTGPSDHRRATRLPFDSAAPPWEIVCEHGVGEVPLLLPFLDLAVLAVGALPLHGAAFSSGGRGTVLTGWSAGGKTTALLAFTGHGARFVGDDRVYVRPDGTVHGIPEPVHVGPTHLASPSVRSRLPRSDVRRLDALTVGARVVGAWAGAPGLPGRTAGWLGRRLATRSALEVAPEVLFGPLGGLTSRLDVVLLMVTSDDPAPVVVPIDRTHLAACVEASLQYERLDLLSAYHAFRFATGRSTDRNLLIEGAAGRERALLAEVLAGAATYEVRHPRPVDADALYAALAPHCG